MREGVREVGASGSGGLVQRGKCWWVHVAQSEEEKACASVHRHRGEGCVEAYKAGGSWAGEGAGEGVAGRCGDL